MPWVLLFKKIKIFCFAAQYSHRMAMKCQINRPKKSCSLFVLEVGAPWNGPFPLKKGKTFV